jgi:hypothetical protein
MLQQDTGTEQSTVFLTWRLVSDDSCGGHITRNWCLWSTWTCSALQVGLSNPTTAAAAALILLKHICGNFCFCKVEQCLSLLASYISDWTQWAHLLSPVNMCYRTLSPSVLYCQISWQASTHLCCRHFVEMQYIVGDIQRGEPWQMQNMVAIQWFSASAIAYGITTLWAWPSWAEFMSLDTKFLNIDILVLGFYTLCRLT